MHSTYKKDTKCDIVHHDDFINHDLLQDSLVFRLIQSAMRG